MSNSASQVVTELEQRLRQGQQQLDRSWRSG
jgi:hypothetical protein